jgi:hypothetical protein
MVRTTSSTAEGRAGFGVSTRARSVIGRPRGSSEIILMPVPPMSMQRVVSA